MEDLFFSKLKGSFLLLWQFKTKIKKNKKQYFCKPQQLSKNKNKVPQNSFLGPLAYLLSPRYIFAFIEPCKNYLTFRTEIFLLCLPKSWSGVCCLARAKDSKKQCIIWFSIKIYHPLLTLLLCESVLVWQINFDGDENGNYRILLRISYISKETKLSSVLLES